MKRGMFSVGWSRRLTCSGLCYWCSDVYIGRVSNLLSAIPSAGDLVNACRYRKHVNNLYPGHTLCGCLSEICAVWLYRRNTTAYKFSQDFIFVNFANQRVFTKMKT